MAFTNCPKCNARVEFEVGTKFTKCSYCSSQIYIDRSGAGFYYIIPFSVQEKDAVGLFRRWAAGPTKAKDLDKRAQLAGIKRQFFPVYQFKRDVDGKEEIRIEPAGSTTLPGLHSLKVPAGDLKIFDGSFNTEGVELIKPDIEMSSYLSQLPGKPKEQALVYFPIWKVRLRLRPEALRGRGRRLFWGGIRGDLSWSRIGTLRGGRWGRLRRVPGRDAGDDHQSGFGWDIDGRDSGRHLRWLALRRLEAVR